MKARAVAQAKERLRHARDAVEQLKQPQDHDHFSRAWSDFLTAANTIFSKLEQGAKATGKSRAWYGRIKHVRKKDALLCYLHHARNTDEHGLDATVQLNAPTLESVDDDYIIPPERRGKEFLNKMPWGKTFKTNINPGSHLIPVRDDRYDDEFSVPFEHLGKALKGGHIWELAELATNTIEKFIAEAEALISDLPPHKP